VHKLTLDFSFLRDSWWGPLSLVSTNEELLGRESSVFGLENRDYGRRDASRWPRDTLYLPKLALTSPTSGGRSVGIVRSQTQATEIDWLHDTWARSEPCPLTRANCRNLQPSQTLLYLTANGISFCLNYICSIEKYLVGFFLTLEVLLQLLYTGRLQWNAPTLEMFYLNLPNPSGRTKPWGLLSL
jgi:hypothetical protein